MKRRKVRSRPDPYWTPRVPPWVQERLRATHKLARLENPKNTWAILLNRWAVAAGVQYRRRLRASGIDYSHLDKPKPEKFTGLPEKPESREY